MLDTASLLQPISAERPSGIDLRLAQLTDHPLDKVRKERKPDDPLLLPPGTEPRKIQWQVVLDTSRLILQKHAKDLEAVAYLTEAMVRQHGLAGLAKGLELATGLLDAFWTDLHPGAPSSEDPEPNLALRGRWITWLGSSELQVALAAVPLQIASRTGSMLTIGDLFDARRVQKAYQGNPAEYARLLEAKVTTPDDWSAALAAAPLDARDAVVAATNACLAGLAALEAKCNERFPAGEVPTASKLVTMLEDLRAEMQQAGQTANPDAPAAAAGGDGAQAAAGSAPRPAGVTVPGAVQSREDAARVLQGVIKFLRATEPHSPVSYLLERCVRWLGMGFDDLMFDLVKDQNVVDLMRERLGIQPPPQP